MKIVPFNKLEGRQAGRAPGRSRGTARPGDYVSTGRDLYHVEQLIGDRAVIEDCRNGDLFDIAADQLTGLRVVARSGSEQLTAQR